MTRIASYVALLLLLAAALPAFACTTAGSMTPEERACCRSMQGQCGEMATIQEMGCCNTHIRSAPQPELAAAPHVCAIPLVVLGHQALPFLTLTGRGSGHPHLPEEYPPPSLVAARSTVLRV